MGRLSIERLGGLAGFGPGSRVRSTGELDMSVLAEDDRAVVAKLFDGSRAAHAHAPMADGFRYRLTREKIGAMETIEVPEAAVPAAVRNCVHDELL